MEEEHYKGKRKMKTAFQLELLEKTYAVDAHPSEPVRAELSRKLGLSDRQLQMWFCHRRLKDRKPPPIKRAQKDAEVSASSSGDLARGEMGNELCSVSGSGSSLYGYNIEPNLMVVPPKRHNEPPLRRHYEPLHVALERQIIASVESQLGGKLREDGPMLGLEFDPLPPGAFGMPIVTPGQTTPPARPYEFNLYERPNAKPIKGAGRDIHEYQFLPKQPSIRGVSYGGAPSHHFGDPPVMQCNEQVPSGYGFQGLNRLPQQSQQDHALPPTSSGLVSLMVPLEPSLTPEEVVSRMERKRKSDETTIAREAEAHEKRMRKELKKQDNMRRKREEQMRKEMEKQERDRRKEEERLSRERQREEERYQRERRREMDRREKFMQKEIIRAEKLKLKEEQRREKEAARLKAANERANTRRIAKESMELIEDERLELMELAAASKGCSIISLNGEDLYNLDLYKDKLIRFPPKSVCLKMPFAIPPWLNSEENVGTLMMVWKFLITFTDLLGLWPFTLDELIQAFHDYDSRLLGEIHIALLRSIIKDIEDVSRAPSSGLGAPNAANPGGGHPQIIEGAYAWGFDIRSWQHHLNPLTWPEILRQFAISSGFGPKLKKRSIERVHLRDENEGDDGEDVIFNLRSGIAAKRAVAIMQEKGFSNPRRSRHRLTPGTVKFAAFHVLSLEGGDGLTILQVADKIQRSGLRDLTTSKTPEASIAAALSRDSKLFERTAPSTYCVRTPYRKDPVDAEAILSSAREKIQTFKKGFINEEDAEDAVHDDVERDEDSESDVAEDPVTNVCDTDSKTNLEGDFSETDRIVAKNVPAKGDKLLNKEVMKTPPMVKNDSGGFATMLQSGGLDPGSGSAVDLSVNATILDQEDIIIDDACESWVQGLMEGEYCDLSVEERLNAIAALIGVANEGNSVRIILEERVEAAYALKKQMWAEAELDKRRMKVEYAMKKQYTPFISNRTGTNGHSSAEGIDSPYGTGSSSNNLVTEQKHINDQQTNLVVPERSPEGQELFAGPDISLLQSGYAAERSRSQLKAYFGHKAEEMYVYRSLPLGQDRRRNRYWQFKTSASQNDPGSGRIIVELHSGFWALIDTEEGFDSLVASLDVRGLRESHLHSMLLMVEVPFKETVRRNLAHCSSGVIYHEKSENAGLSTNPDIGISTSSSTRSVSAFTYNNLETSSSFVIGLARNETERSDLYRRYQDFGTWMWKECLDSSALCAVKYGKNRCEELLGSCDDCCDLYLTDDNHCPSCHRIYKTYTGGSTFSEHVAQCTEELKGNVGLFSQSLDSSLPMRIRLLKKIFSLLEVSIPVEALKPAWSEDLRKSVGDMLHAASSPKDILQILALLEGSIKTDFLSSDFERTSELSGARHQTASDANMSTVSVLPWIPKTSSAVALRLLELDSSIFFTLRQKVDWQKTQAAGDFVTPPSKSAVERDVPDDALVDASHEVESMQPDPRLDSSNLLSNSGRRRGTRNRGRGRGGRPPKKSLSSRPEIAPRGIPTNKEGLGQLVGWKGRPRAQGGRKRGRPRGGKVVRSERITEVNNGRDQSKQIIYEPKLSRTTHVLPQWGREAMQVEGADVDDDSNSSESEGSEYKVYDDGLTKGDGYDDSAMDDYGAVFSGNSVHLLEVVDYDIRGVGDEAGDDDNRTEDMENDMNDECDVEEDGQDDMDAGRYIDGQDDMDAGRYIDGHTDEGDGFGEHIGNPDDVTSSSSSEYSD